MIEKAIDYLLTLVTENEEVKKFPRDFVTASMKWVRSWFLIEDPVSEAILTSPGNDAAKKIVVEQKLPNLLENGQFVQELQAQLQNFATERERFKNIVTDANIEAKGKVHIGDQGAADTAQYDRKNLVQGGSIKTEGDFHLGDDVTG